MILYSTKIDCTELTAKLSVLVKVISIPVQSECTTFSLSMTMSKNDNKKCYQSPSPPLPPLPTLAPSDAESTDIFIVLLVVTAVLTGWTGLDETLLSDG